MSVLQMITDMFRTQSRPTFLVHDVPPHMTCYQIVASITQRTPLMKQDMLSLPSNPTEFTPDFSFLSANSIL